jgi:hypothetical protein
MKKIFPVFVFLVIFMTCKVTAQSKEDVIYLSNGSILRGKVIEHVSGVQTSIEIVGHNVLVFPDSVIKMLLRDQPVKAKDRENKASPVEMAANISFYGGSDNSTGFTFITSYRFPFRLATGVGVGIEWFDHQQIPLMGDIKYYFLKGSWSPYVYAQCGYAFQLSTNSEGDWSEYYGGVLVGTGGGMRFDFSKRNALIFSVGYRFQQTKTVTGSYPWYSSMYQPYETTRYDKYNRLTFSLGFLFN